MTEAFDKRSDWWKYAISPLREAIDYAQKRKKEAAKGKRSTWKKDAPPTTTHDRSLIPGGVAGARSGRVRWRT